MKARAPGFCREVKVVTVREEPAGRLHTGPFDTPQAIFNLWNAVIAVTKNYQEDKEHLFSFLLDARRKLKGFSLVSLGSLNECLAHLREIFRPAIVASAQSIIVAHNHPSGDPSPSLTDCYLTRRLYEAGELLQMPLLDHIIVGDRGYFSFYEAGWPPRRPRAQLTEFGKIARRDMLARARRAKRKREASRKEKNK